MHGVEERCAVLLQMRDDRTLPVGEFIEGGRTAKASKVISQEQRQPSIAFAEWLDPAPDDFPCCRQGIEIGGIGHTYTGA